jgi:hypothetical protein
LATKTEICNLALAHLGSTKFVADVDTEQSTEASLFNRFYELARRQTMADAPWPFASQIDALGLVEEDPNDEWGFSYRYPSGAVTFKRILSGSRTDTRQSRVSFKESSDITGRLILTDAVDAEGEWTADIDDTSLFTDAFTMALSYRIAVYMAPSLTAGDPFKLGASAFQLYQLEVGRAQANAANAEQPDEDPDAEYIRGRS